ncbi:hypothetical protein Ndes2437B_g06092 [Nannochloris sp. 'desiccata']
MDCNCSCLGPTAAAKVPVKRYNLLVPAIFPVTEPNWTKPLGISTEKNIKRLSEYLERNEHRIPKVSRRLARRLHYDLSKNRLGFVRVAVAAYTHLATTESGRFARLYSKELIVRYPTKKRYLWGLVSPRPAASNLPPSSAHLGSVVGALISSPQPPAQQWGLELLTTLLKQQETAEFIGTFETLVPLLCSKACSSTYAITTVKTRNGKREGGGGEGVAEDSDTAVVTAVPTADGERDPANLIASLSLQALLEHLRLCFRLSYVSFHLDSITYAVLSIMEAAGAATGIDYSTASKAVAAGVSLPLSSLARESVGARVGASSPGYAALLVYQELGQMTRDAAEGKKVLEFLFRYLDQMPKRWLGGPALDVGLGVMRDACSQEHQRFLLTTALIVHVGAAKGLNETQRVAVLEQAMKDAAVLETSMAPSALLQALQELPKALASVRDLVQTEQSEFGKAVITAVRSLAGQVGTRLQLTSALGAAMTRLGGPSAPLSTGTLQCCAAASNAYSTLPPRALGASATPHLPNVLLRSALGICLSWNPKQRLLAHQILRNALTGVPQGSYMTQVMLVLSSIWHEVALVENTPECFKAMDATLGAVVSASSGAEEQLRACQVALSLQNEVLLLSSPSSSSTAAARLGNTQPAQLWAILALSASLLHRVAHRVISPSLQTLTVLNSSSNDNAIGLPSLILSSTTGLETPGSTAISHFNEADHVVARQILASLPQQQQEDAAAKILASISSFKSLLPGPSTQSLAFVPLPRASIAPPITLAAPVSAADGSEAPPSPRAKRLQAAFSGAASTGGGGSIYNEGKSVQSDDAVAGSRFAVDTNGTDGGESMEGRSTFATEYSGSHGGGGDAHSNKAGSFKQLAPSLTEVLAGVEAALVSVGSN